MWVWIVWLCDYKMTRWQIWCWLVNLAFLSLLWILQNSDEWFITNLDLQPFIEFMTWLYDKFHDIRLFSSDLNLLGLTASSSSSSALWLCAQVQMFMVHFSGKSFSWSVLKHDSDECQPVKVEYYQRIGQILNNSSSPKRKWLTALEMVALQYLFLNHLWKLIFHSYPF